MTFCLSALSQMMPVYPGWVSAVSVLLGLEIARLNQALSVCNLLYPR